MTANKLAKAEKHKIVTANPGICAGISPLQIFPDVSQSLASKNKLQVEEQVGQVSFMQQQNPDFVRNPVFPRSSAEIESLSTRFKSVGRYYLKIPPRNHARGCSILNSCMRLPADSGGRTSGPGGQDSADNFEKNQRLS